MGERTLGLAESLVHTQRNALSGVEWLQVTDHTYKATSRGPRFCRAIGRLVAAIYDSGSTPESALCTSPIGQPYWVAGVIRLLGRRKHIVSTT